MILLTRDDLSFVKNKGCALALGTFDGLHRGHIHIIEEARRRAEGLPLAVYCFSNVPARFLRGLPEKTVRTAEEKIRDFEEIGVDALLMEPFTHQLAAQTPEDFERFVFETMAARVVSVGFNYSYGRRAGGTAETLTAAGERYGAQVCVSEPIEIGGEPVSSTRLRRAVSEGDMELTAALIGRPYDICGVVERGNSMGSKIGFPTANLRIDDKKQPPELGVYRSETIMGGKSFKSVTNVGIHPTVEPLRGVFAETHIPGFSGELYGETIKVLLHSFMRPERRFPSVDALKEQLARDIAAAMED